MTREKAINYALIVLEEQHPLHRIPLTKSFCFSGLAYGTQHEASLLDAIEDTPETQVLRMALKMYFAKKREDDGNREVKAQAIEAIKERIESLLYSI
jgi:hypothetical protein